MWKRLVSAELLIPLGAFVGTFAAIDGHASDAFLEKYDTSMRAVLFSGFFTLSSFLLAAKTFLMVNMKKEVYGDDSYLFLVLDRRRLRQAAPPETGILEVYRPLRRIGDLLSTSVAFSLTTAALQFTLGFWKGRIQTAVCIATAAAAASLLAFSLYFFWRNICDMCQEWEAGAQRKMKSPSFLQDYQKHLAEKTDAQE
jgi:hypothetical protein